MKPLLYYFYKDSCPFCVTFHPIMFNADVQKIVNQQYIPLYIDVQQNKAFNSKIVGVPTVLLTFDNLLTVARPKYYEVPLTHMKTPFDFMSELINYFHLYKQLHENPDTGNHFEPYQRTTMLGLNTKGMNTVVDNSKFQHGLIPGVLVNGTLDYDPSCDMKLSDQYNLNCFNNMAQMHRLRAKELSAIMNENEKKCEAEQHRLNQIEKQKKKLHYEKVMDDEQKRVAETSETQFVPIFVPPQPNTYNNYMFPVSSWDPKSKSTLYGKGKRLGSKLQNGIGANEGLARTDERYYTAFLPRRLETGNNPYGKPCLK